MLVAQNGNNEIVVKNSVVISLLFIPGRIYLRGLPGISLIYWLQTRVLSVRLVSGWGGVSSAFGHMAWNQSVPYKSGDQLNMNGV